MKTYEITMTYEYTTYANEKDIINFFIKKCNLTEEQAKKHFESLSDSEIKEVIVCSGDWDPIEVDDLSYRESRIDIDYGTYKD